MQLIREAEARDIEPMSVLMGHLGYPTTVEEMEHRFKNISMTSTYHTQVAEVSGLVVGMVGMVLGLPYNRNNPYVRNVAFVVDEDFRNQGPDQVYCKQLKSGPGVEMLICSC
ncbi:GNAT family N-acetyltransferase [Halobacillus yeomjeoni]|uniref:GNAT family N-acetyltransferase n=1 Tax=Halobacillus yeomjeoni TaxID=311194 RepID=UPI001CD711E2|nr:GNAT family N-acetyltransferase [Halobacillus yeomjeoni]MCA0983205.1 GNAT family N-acetyltransferase [Halobacillus yeomjeoni]